MGLFDSMRKQLENAAKTAQKAAENLPDSVKQIDVDKTFKGFKKAGEDAVQKFKTGSTDLYSKTVNSFQKKEPTPYIRSEDALKIMYYLIAADMSMKAEEMEMFDSIGREVQSDYEAHRNEIIGSCNSVIVGTTDPDEYYDIIHEQVSAAIHNSQNSAEGDIMPALLIWNMISIAFSENEYSALERRLIRSTARTLGLDEAVPKEMEAAARTMIALAKEEEILQASDRKFSEVKVHMDEIAERKQTVMENIKALMLD